MQWLDYEAYTPLAVKAFEQIADEAAARWPGRGWQSTIDRAAGHRRGQRRRSSAASPHRAEAFAVCRYAIERVKQIAPIWKREYFDGGDVWIEGATADPGDEARARRRHGTSVHVTVRLFARLRDIAGTAELSRRASRWRDRAGCLGRAGRRVSRSRRLRDQRLVRGERIVRAA